MAVPKKKRSKSINKNRRFINLTKKIKRSSITFYHFQYHSKILKLLLY